MIHIINVVLKIQLKIVLRIFSDFRIYPTLDWSVLLKSDFGSDWIGANFYSDWIGSDFLRKISDRIGVKFWTPRTSLVSITLALYLSNPPPADSLLGLTMVQR